MNILWITNNPFPEITDEIKEKKTIKGWVYSAANAFLEYHGGINLAVASIYNGKELKEIKKGKLTHYLLPKIVRTSISNYRIDSIWGQIKKQFNPELIHIHGSEYPHSYSCVRFFGNENIVVSIQGLVSIIEKYYLGGINTVDLLKSVTFRDIARLDTIFSQRKKMQSRGEIEKLLFQNVKHVIGRTSWDRDHVWAVNHEANYHFCNETLRSVFYENQWSLDECERYSIFVSQAYYPLKGFHRLVEALPFILKHYPKTKIYVAGNNYFTDRGIRLNGFGNYINSLIKRYKLSNNIIFTGLLSEEAICQQFLNSHIFVCPSAIENSPNSIGEAQLLGVPCVASYVGGISDMITHNKTGLMYRYEEVEMLASNICRLFGNDELTLKISAEAKVVAAERHNKIKNANDLLKIYTKIINKN